MAKSPSKLELLRKMREKTSKSRKPRPPKKPKAKISVIAEARAKAKAAKASNGERGAKSFAVAEMLKRPKGCTGKDVKAATGWQSVSMPAMAKQLGIKLRIEKVPGEPTRYFGA